MVAIQDSGDHANAALAPTHPKKFSLLRCVACCECDTSAPATPLALPQTSDSKSSLESNSQSTAALTNTKLSTQPLSVHPLVYVLAKHQHDNMCSDIGSDSFRSAGSSSRPPKFLVGTRPSNDESSSSVFKETTLTKSFRHEARRLQESQESDNPPVHFQ